MNPANAVRNVLILGAGNIGAFYDAPNDAAVLSHAHAFSTHPDFNLLGFVDVDTARAEKAAGLWGVKAYGSIDDAFQNNRVDVAVVATPDETHADLLRTLAEKPVRFVLAEKPLALGSREAEKIAGVYDNAGIRLAVNYSRRYVPEFHRLAGRIHGGEFGRFLGGTGYYGKGLFHNGSHLLDQALMFLGDLAVVSVTGSIFDFRPQDPSLSAVLETGSGGELRIQAVDSRQVTQYELDLLFERGRVRIFDLGRRLEISMAREDAQYAGYRTYSPQEHCRPALDQALMRAVENLADALDGKELLKCGAPEAVRVLKLCEDIRAAAPASAVGV